MSAITCIGFDADDTLWHNETFFQLTQSRFGELLADHTDPDHLAERLLAAEMRNIGQYGFGIKGFVLSMIETAIEVTEARVPASVIAQILEAGQDMLRHPIDLLPRVQDAIETLADNFPLVMITKGDLLDQERKLAQSGLGDLFAGVEIVSNKTPQTYVHTFAQYGTGAEHAMMVGNSMKSDVRPALEAGAHGVFVPFELAWALEHAAHPDGHPRFHEVADLGAVPPLVEQLNNP